MVLSLVSGDANFSMDYTGLNIGGFTQANVARGFIESTANVEKGLIQINLTQKSLKIRRLINHFPILLVRKHYILCGLLTYTITYQHI